MLPQSISEKGTQAVAGDVKLETPALGKPLGDFDISGVTLLPARGWTFYRGPTGVDAATGDIESKKKKRRKILNLLPLGGSITGDRDGWGCADVLCAPRWEWEAAGIG